MFFLSFALMEKKQKIKDNLTHPALSHFLLKEKGNGYNLISWRLSSHASLCVANCVLLLDC